jgi:hypothetical protein
VVFINHHHDSRPSLWVEQRLGQLKQIHKRKEKKFLVIFLVLLGIWWLINHVKIEDKDIDQTFGRQEKKDE